MSRQLIPFLSILFLCNLSIVAMDFIIPVGAMDLPESQGAITLLVAHLRKDGENRLLILNDLTQETSSALAPLYNPIMIQLLPNHQEFSFLDNGRLRIKDFKTRAAKTMPINDKKIIETGMYTWLDDTTCCICAWKTAATVSPTGSIEQKGTYGIYSVKRDGITTCLISSPNYDALFPVLCDDSLFYIRREVDVVLCSVMQRNLHDLSEEELVLQSTVGEFDGIITVSEAELYAFLFLGDHYSCIKSWREDDGWDAKEIFTFRAQGCGYQDPFNVLTPLLIENHLFVYMDGYDLCSYNVETEEHTIINHGSPKRILCAPRYIDQLLYCGCVTAMGDNPIDLLWTNKSKAVCCDLPRFDISHLLQRETSQIKDDADVTVGREAQSGAGTDEASSTTSLP